MKQYLQKLKISLLKDKSVAIVRNGTSIDLKVEPTLEGANKSLSNLDNAGENKLLVAPQLNSILIHNNEKKITKHTNDINDIHKVDTKQTKDIKDLGNSLIALGEKVTKKVEIVTSEDRTIKIIKTGNKVDLAVDTGMVSSGKFGDGKSTTTQSAAGNSKAEQAVIDEAQDTKIKTNKVDITKKANKENAFDGFINKELYTKHNFMAIDDNQNIGKVTPNGFYVEYSDGKTKLISGQICW